MDISGVYHSANPFLTCILHCINNYLGFSKYTKNILPVPTTLTSFLELFKENSSNTCVMVLPSHYFHIFIQNNWLKHIDIKYIFHMQNRHIYTLKRANKIWIKLDSHPSIKSIIDEKGMLFEISNGTGFIIIIDMDKLPLFHTIISEWNPSNGYYREFKRQILDNIHI